jgi:NTE family protein
MFALLAHRLRRTLNGFTRSKGIPMTSTAGTENPAASSGPAADRADLVLEGGGVKGIALAGAVQALATAGYRFPRVAGTSAGAIVAAIVAALERAEADMSVLEKYLREVDYVQFERAGRVQRALGRFGDLAHLGLSMGMYNGAYLAEWLGPLLKGLGCTRFGDLRMDDPQSSLPEQCRYSLVVHTADITRRRCIRLPWDYGKYGKVADDQLIVDAVRASMAIPFFFTPVRFRAPTAEFDGHTYEGGRVTWVDGGVLANFPINVFDRTDGQPARWGTIGVKLSADAVITPPGHDPRNAVEEAVDIVRTTLDNADRYYVTATEKHPTVFVDASFVSGTNFHLDARDATQLYCNGWNAANEQQQLGLAPKSP